MKNVFRMAFLAIGATVALVVPARADSPQFRDMFGRFDKVQIVRGFEVFRQVCSACHALDFRFVDLVFIGGPELPIQKMVEIAGEYEVGYVDPAYGEYLARPASPYDRFPTPFPNDFAAKAANGDALPPELSWVAGNYEDVGPPPWFLHSIERLERDLFQRSGDSHIYSVLTGYVEAPESPPRWSEGAYYNVAWPTRWIQMPPPLADDMISYATEFKKLDRAPDTAAQYAIDVSAFLLWAAEPPIESRQKIVLRIYLNIVVIAALLYWARGRLWGCAKEEKE